MSRNITIVVVILIVVLLSFYLVWLRNHFGVISPNEQIGIVIESASPVASLSPTPTPSPVASVTASPSAKPTKSASPSAKASPKK